MKALLLFAFIATIAGCAAQPRKLNYLEEIQAKAMTDRFMARMEIETIQQQYLSLRDYIRVNLPNSYPAAVAGYVFRNLSVKAIEAALTDPDKVSTLAPSYDDEMRPKHHPEVCALADAECSKCITAG